MAPRDHVRGAGLSTRMRCRWGASGGTCGEWGSRRSRKPSRAGQRRIPRAASSPKPAPRVRPKSPRPSGRPTKWYARATLATLSGIAHWCSVYGNAKAPDSPKSRFALERRAERTGGRCFNVTAFLHPGLDLQHSPRLRRRGAVAHTAFDTASRRALTCKHNVSLRAERG
jgi:hypothetical protein